MGLRPLIWRRCQLSNPWRATLATDGECGVRRLLSQDHYLGQVIDRLEQVSRVMNPLLLYIAVSLVVLNLTCLFNLIDWSHLPQTSAETPAASAPNSTNSK